MALGDVGDETDVPLLERAFRGDDMGVVRREAYLALQKLKRG
jgi:HEAT repeat protein